ncbi:beta-lactamase/transpeptidase-like protein [Whalleya microplaca]|nr:beta-lactamase/transpeptidase-like protein [Whalleya microplaca]
MASFDEILVSQSEPGANKVFGACVKVINKLGETVYSKSSGRVKFDTSEQPSEDTAYWAFSWTKLITTIAGLQCVERGQIALDDEVEAILPELKDPMIIATGPDGGFVLKPAVKKITFRHLLTHQSGITYDARSPLLLEWRKSRGEGPMSFCGDIVKAFSIPLLFEPGESWSYGGSLDWAGVVIERLNLMTLGEYMEKYIFTPLSMKSTTFHPNTKPGLQQRIMDIPMRTAMGELIPTKCWYPPDAPTDSGGVGIVTTVGDYTKILADLLRDDPIVLEASSVNQMFTPQFEKMGPQAVGLMDQFHMHSELTGGEATLGKLSFGLGGLLTLDSTPILPPATLTWGAMPCMEWFINRDQGIAGAFGTQMLPPGDKILHEVIQEFIKTAMQYGK